MRCVHPDCTLDAETLALFKQKRSDWNHYVRDHWRMCHMAMGCRMLIVCPLYKGDSRKKCKQVFGNMMAFSKHLRGSRGYGDHQIHYDQVEDICNAVRLLWQQEDPNNRGIFLETMRRAPPTDLTNFLLQSMRPTIRKLGMEHMVAQYKATLATVSNTSHTPPLPHLYQQTTHVMLKCRTLRDNRV
jgi:hypothetical protein